MLHIYIYSELEFVLIVVADLLAIASAEDVVRIGRYIYIPLYTVYIYTGVPLNIRIYHPLSAVC